MEPSGAKQNQAKLLGFAWLYSSESGLFNGLRRIQTKKSGLVSGTVQNVASLSSPPGAAQAASPVWQAGRLIARISIFRKKTSGKIHGGGSPPGADDFIATRPALSSQPAPVARHYQ
jgi:hypothetical protein